MSQSTATHTAVIGREQIESNLPLPAQSRLRKCDFCAILPDYQVVQFGLARYEEVTCRCHRSVRQLATARPDAVEIWNGVFTQARTRHSSLVTRH